MAKYKVLEDGYIGYGSFGEVWRVENEETKKLFVMKWFERGPKIDENVVREIIIHKLLCHPNVIQFKEVVLSSHYLGIVMEYAAGGNLNDQIFNDWQKKRLDKITKGKKKGLGEDVARKFFQQLMSGVSYCHSMGVCHRDLKPENILLDGNNPPRLKICDFGFSKSYRLHSKPNSAVGTPLYMAPEVCSSEYNGKLADVWSCGMILYNMLVGGYPTITRETSNEKNACPFQIPLLPGGSKDLLTRMLVENPEERITIEEIMEHKWYKKELPGNLAEATLVTKENPSFSLQCDEEIWKIIEEAKISPPEEDVESGEEEEEDEN